MRGLYQGNCGKNYLFIVTKTLEVAICASFDQCKTLEDVKITLNNLFSEFENFRDDSYTFGASRFEEK